MLSWRFRAARWRVSQLVRPPNLPDHPREDVSGAQLHERRLALVQEELDALSPAHGTDHLCGQRVSHVVGRVRSCEVIRDDRERQWPDVTGLEETNECRLHGFHRAGMKRAADVEADDVRAGLAEDWLGGLDV